MGQFFQDLKYCLRILRKNPGFSLVAVMTLALGIGANAAMFAIANTVLLQPLPFQDSAQLVSVWTTDKKGERMATAVPDFRLLREQNRTLEGLAGFYRRPVNITGNQEPERARVLFVSPDFFTVLRIQPAIGRAFSAKEEEPGSNHVVILSDGMWRRDFAARPDVVGQTINIDGMPHSIIGVLPQDFWFADLGTELIVPASFAQGDLLNNRSNHILNMVGRLRPGVTASSAATDLANIGSDIGEQFLSNKGMSFDLLSLQEQLVGSVRTSVLVLMIAVAFVLLIACANLANILMVRSVARQKETAVRSALGATYTRLLRQHLTESILLSAMGGMLGLLLAYLTIRSVRLISPATLPRASQIHLDPWVLVFALVISVLTGIIFGLIPVVHAWKINVNETLKEGGKASGAGGGYRLVRSGLVVTEVAAALVLLAGAGLTLTSLHMLKRIDLGFDPTRVLVFNVSLPSGKYLNQEFMRQYPMPAATEKAAIFLQEAVNQIGTVPGVTSAGAVSLLPISGVSWGKVVTFYDRPLPPTLDGLPPIEYRVVVGDYFKAMGIRLVHGRVLDEHDTERTALVAVVNEEFVHRYMEDKDAVGKPISVNPPASLAPGFTPPGFPQKFTIVGVVSNARNNSPDQQADPAVYVPYAQNAESNLTMSFAIRTDRDPFVVLGTVRRRMYELDANLPLAAIDTMEQRLDDTIGRPQLAASVLGAFGGLALLLAGLGVYGVMSYSVAQRTREIGIRMALGARLMDVMRMILREGLLLTLAGLAIGFAGAIALARLMKSMIFGISSTDPMVFTAIAVLLFLTAFIATYFPARRASKVDPQVALRDQ
jgi:putative ABC transport system permease protein